MVFSVVLHNRQRSEDGSRDSVSSGWLVLRVKVPGGVPRAEAGCHL